MGSTTPVYALPYPVGSDRVRDGDNAIQALAERVEAVIAPGLVPAGVVAPFAGGVAPAGWLLAAGGTADRTVDAALFGVIGTTYGAGDGSTTFGLPDLRSRLPLGNGPGAGLRDRARGAAGGAEDSTLPAHAHGASGSSGGMSASHTHATGSGDVGGLGGGGSLVRKAGGNPIDGTGGASTDHSHAISVGIANAGVSPADTNMPPYLVLNYIIKR